MHFPSDAMTWQDCSGCQTKRLKKDFQCYPWSQVSWLVWQTPEWALPQYSKGLLPKSIRTASWRSKVVPEGQKTSLKVDECCHLLSSWSEKCSFVFVKKLCSWRWTKYRTYENIMVSKNQKPIHLVTKRPGSCFLSYCKSFLPVQSAGIWKAWNLVTNKISSRTSKVFQSY